MATDYWNTVFEQHIIVLTETRKTAKQAYDAMLELCIQSVRDGHTIYLCGNGGSAADAQHIAAELTGKLDEDRLPISAISLATDPSTVTAIANDYGYDEIFSRQVQAHVTDGDVVIGISTSGTSKNIVNALKKAQELHVKTVAITGALPANGHDTVASFADIVVPVPSSNTQRVQEMHTLIGHVLCAAIQEAVMEQ